VAIQVIQNVQILFCTVAINTRLTYIIQQPVVNRKCTCSSQANVSHIYWCQTE